MSTNIYQARPISEAHSKLLQGVLEQLMAMKGVRHAIVAVESRDGSFRWVGTEGVAQPDGTLMQADTPFWIASVTKLYIACTILKLHETGMLSIDDTVINYLPESLLKGLHVVNGVDYYDTLTIRHLLRHSSGIPDYLEIKSKGEQTLIDRVLEDGDMSWSIEDTLQIVRKVNAPLFAPQPLFDRKCRIRYSDTNFQMLIAIIETVTKQSINAAFRDMLFKSLNLRSTFHPGLKPLESVKPEATVWIEDTPFNKYSQAMRSLGDLNSTVKDLIEFMRALLDGKVFDKPETLELMRGQWNTFGFCLSPLAPGWPIQYGLGMMRFQMPRLLSPITPMPEVIGHTGAVGSWLFYCPSLDMILAGTVSQVTAAAAPFKIMPKLLRILENTMC